MWWELEAWFNEDETEVRRMSGKALVKRTVELLGVWWRCMGVNAKLRRLREKRWIGIEREF